MHGSLFESSTEAMNRPPSGQPAMNAAQQFVVVKAPLERVYEQWSRIGNRKRLVELAENRE